MSAQMRQRDAITLFGGLECCTFALRNTENT
jgi:hypothetical protein